MSTEQATDGGSSTETETERRSAPLIHVVPEASAEQAVERFEEIQAAVNRGELDADDYGNMRDFVKDAVDWEEQIIVGGEPLGDWLLKHDELSGLRIKSPDED